MNEKIEFGRLSFKTTKKLRDLINSIADIEKVSLSDTIHAVYQQKFNEMARDIDLPVGALEEANNDFQYMLLVG